MIRASSERVVGRHGGSSTLRTTLSCASLASSGLFTETLMSRRSARSASLSPAPKSRGHGRCYSPRRFASRHVPTAAEELAQHSQVLEPSVIKRFDGLMRHLKRNTDKQDFEKQVLASPPDVLVPEEYDEVLRGEFSRHCSFGERLNTELMHSGKWVKMLKELGFVPGPGKAKGPCLSSLAVADIIFQRVLHDTDYGGKRLTYDFFCKALCLVAVNMYPNMDWEAAMGELLQRIATAAEALPETLGKTHFLVAFPQQESNAQVPPEISCIDQRELVALPAKHSDWLTPVEETLKNCHEVRAALQDLQLPQAIIADEAEDEEEEDSSESCTLEAEDEDESEGHSPGKMRTRQPEHDLFGSFARRQLPSPMDARTGTGTTRLKERSIWKHTQDTVFASRASSCMLGGTFRDDDLPENQDETSMSPGLPAVKEVFEEHSEATGAPESDTRPEQDSLDPNPEASLPHQVASPERGSPERRRRPQLPSGAFSGSGFLSPKSGPASGQNRRSFMSLEQLFALCKELKIMPDLMSRQAVVRIFKRAQCAGSASAHGGSNFGYLSQEAAFSLTCFLTSFDGLLFSISRSRLAPARMFICCVDSSADDKELPPAKLVTSDEVLPARSSTVAQELTIGARPAKEECFTFSVDVVRSPGTSFGVDISAAGKVCMVNAVQAGSLVGDWNNQCTPDHRIRQYDRLMAFNGDRPSKGKEMLEKLRDASGPVTITVQRPVVQQVIVSKNGKELGLGVIDGQSFLLVTRIAEGAVNDHNLAAASDQVIKVPSRIVTVDGKKGSGAELLKLMENVAGSEGTCLGIEFMQPAAFAVSIFSGRESAKAGLKAFVDAMGRIAVQAYTEEPYCDEYPEPHEKILAFLSDRLPGQIRTMRESFRYGCSGRGPAVTPGYIGRR
ncbi:hypothetical protein AK812_SmicGene7830 [Symbiodinium microadriaticum]|uniref:PDZ domain-containing protein n=1 Tax=Symbiodinium microadriaticum TaxID=2951 RepID=A0A1Q9EMK8_SYMMI|nr:hypothetical protein AK812_SmicGene7830 [Symbiodinium microadriaticum]